MLCYNNIIILYQGLIVMNYIVLIFYQITVEESTLAPSPESSNNVTGTVVAVVVVVVITTVIGVIIAVVLVMIYRHKYNSKNVQILGS